MLNQITWPERQILSAAQAQYISARRVIQKEQERVAFGGPALDVHGRHELAEARGVLRTAIAKASRRWNRG